MQTWLRLAVAGQLLCMAFVAALLVWGWLHPPQPLVMRRVVYRQCIQEDAGRFYRVTLAERETPWPAQPGHPSLWELELLLIEPVAPVPPYQLKEAS